METLDPQERMLHLPGSPDFPVVSHIRDIDGFQNLTKEQQEKALSQWKRGMAEDDMSQLIDRIASNNFQG
ncbi:MAG: hypothetical protein J1E62_05120 [Lachnospiraceae bacterium]|nr:hypothetical protein [Lachnospiraceae bacterium]